MSFIRVILIAAALGVLDRPSIADTPPPPVKDPTPLESVSPQDIIYKERLAYHHDRLFTGLILKKNQKGVAVQEIETRQGETIRLVTRSNQGWKFYEVDFARGLPLERRSWDPEGRLLGTLTYRFGKPWRGLEVEYSSSRRWKDHEYHDGVLTRRAYYHPNGKKAYEYLRDAKSTDGVQTFWNPEGRQTAMLTFRKEEPWEGTFQNWIEGRLVSEQEYLQGTLGKRTTFRDSNAPTPAP